MSKERVDSRLRVWNQLRGQPGPLRSIEILESPVFVAGSVPLGQFTALVGLHGAGKSYLISMIDSALPGWQVMPSLPVDMEDNKSGLRGQYVISLCRDGQIVDISVSRPLHWKERVVGGEAIRPLVSTVLTAPGMVGELAYVAGNWSPQHVPLPTVFEKVPRKDLDVVGRITGHVYDWLECGIIDPEETCFPYMRGVRDSRPVDSWSMSSSEFWVHYILWCLRTADADEVLLIDEPETSLAEPGHQAFVDEIARLTLASGCQTILATHSEAMLRRIPSECVLLLTSGPDGSEVSQVLEVESILRALSRRRISPTLLVFAEDELGVRIGRAILLRFAPGRVDEIDIVDSGGKDQARTAARLLGRSLRIGAVALLDGDERARATGTDLFLPGDRSPEAELMDALRTYSDRASTALHVAKGDLLAALDVTRFAHHQACFQRMAEALGGRSSADLVEATIDVWLDLPEVASAGERLAQQVVALLGQAT